MTTATGPSRPSMLFITFLATITSFSACSGDISCPATPNSMNRQGQSLLQVTGKPKTNPFANLATWQAEKPEHESPAALVERQEKPSCDQSNLTNACLPSFMIIGMQKGGTSSLYNILSTHPQIQPAEKKELLWFNGNFENLKCSPPESKPTEDEFKTYLHNFPRLHDAEVLTGEFSATYMHCWCCPKAMKRLMPNLRFITQLRDPIERARSRWTEQHSWAKKIETYDSFETYVEMELPKLAHCLAKSEGFFEFQTHCAADSNILGLSVYDPAIKLWLKYFPRKSFLVTYLEQLATEPQSVASAIHNHLGIKDLQYNHSLLFNHYNAKGNYGWKKAVEGLQIGNYTALEKLFAFYRPHMKELKDMADAGLISPLPKSWISRWGL